MIFLQAIKDFIVSPVNGPQHLAFKVGAIVLVTMVLMMGIKALDGDNHRLGTIQIQLPNNPTES